MRKGVQPMMQLDPVESSYPSYDVSQSGSFSFRNFKLSKGGVETENGLLEHTIDIASLDLENARSLGSGSSGRVVEARHKPSGKLYAVKKIPITEKHQRDEIQKELQMINQETEREGMFNKRIIGVYGAQFDMKGYILIPMERMDGSLADVISQTKTPVTESQLRCVMFQVLEGLMYLHDTRKMVHRDIKPANLLLNNEGLVKISDFGISREAQNATNINTFVGTQFFMSPERLKGQSYSFSGDIWSLGITLLHCAMQKNPWLSVGVTERSTFFELLKLLDGGVVPQMPDMYGESAKGFAQSCLRVDAASRPSASSLLSSDPWTRGTTAEEAESVVKDWVTGLSERTNNGSGFHAPLSTDTLEALDELDAEINGF